MFTPKRRVYTGFLFFLVCTYGSRSSSQSSIQHVIKEHKVQHSNNHVFDMYREIQNGTLSESWKIDGKPAEEAIYEHELLEAEKEDRRQLFAAERQEAQERADQLVTLRRAAARRIIDIARDRIRASIRHIREYDMEQHLIWEPQTISSREEYERIVSTMASGDDYAHRLIDEEADSEKIQKYAAQLEEQSKHLDKLFFDSVKHVIAHTSDTKLLRKLMELV